MGLKLLFLFYNKIVAYYYIELNYFGLINNAIITIFIQILMRKLPGDICEALLCGPTGKAVLNFNGNTLHRAFKLPIDQNTGSLIPYLLVVTLRIL